MTIVKIYYQRDVKTYWTLNLYSTADTLHVLDIIATKLNKPKARFSLFEKRAGGVERRLEDDTNILEIVNAWGEHEKDISRLIVHEADGDVDVGTKTVGGDGSGAGVGGGKKNVLSASVEGMTASTLSALDAASRAKQEAIAGTAEERYVKASQIFADELWDNFPVVVDQVKAGERFNNNFAKFFARYAQLEMEHAKKLMELCKQSREEHKDPVGSLEKSLDRMKGNLYDIGASQLRFSEKVRTSVADLSSGWSAKHKKGMKEQVDAGNKILAEFDKAEPALMKARANYEKAMLKILELKGLIELKRIQEERMSERLTRDQSDKALEKERNQIRSLGVKYTKQKGKAEKAAEKERRAYEKAIERYVRVQRMMQDTDLSVILSNLQRYECDRIAYCKVLMTRFAAHKQSHTTESSAAMSTLGRNVREIDPIADAREFSKKFRSLRSKPPMATFEPFDEEAKCCRLPEVAKTTAFDGDFAAREARDGGGGGGVTLGSESELDEQQYLDSLKSGGALDPVSPERAALGSTSHGDLRGANAKRSSAPRPLSQTMHKVGGGTDQRRNKRMSLREPIRSSSIAAPPSLTMPTGSGTASPRSSGSFSPVMAPKRPTPPRAPTPPVAPAAPVAPAVATPPPAPAPAPASSSSSSSSGGGGARPKLSFLEEVALKGGDNKKLKPAAERRLSTSGGMSHDDELGSAIAAIAGRRSAIGDSDSDNEDDDDDEVDWEASAAEEKAKREAAEAAAAAKAAEDAEAALTAEMMALEAVDDKIQKDFDTLAETLYGPHFPELITLCKDPLKYARAVLCVERREDTAELRRRDADVSAELHAAAVNSKGDAISDSNLDAAKELAESLIAQVRSMQERLVALNNGKVLSAADADAKADKARQADKVRADEARAAAAADAAAAEEKRREREALVAAAEAEAAAAAKAAEEAVAVQAAIAAAAARVAEADEQADVAAKDAAAAKAKADAEEEAAVLALAMVSADDVDDNDDDEDGEERRRKSAMADEALIEASVASKEAADSEAAVAAAAAAAAAMAAAEAASEQESPRKSSSSSKKSSGSSGSRRSSRSGSSSGSSSRSSRRDSKDGSSSPRKSSNSRRDGSTSPRKSSRGSSSRSKSGSSSSSSRHSSSSSSSKDKEKPKTEDKSSGATTRAAGGDGDDGGEFVALFRVIGLHTYKDGGEGKLSFKKGELLEVYNEQNGWMFGASTVAADGVRGHFPSSWVKKVK